MKTIKRTLDKGRTIGFEATGLAPGYTEEKKALTGEWDPTEDTADKTEKLSAVVALDLKATGFDLDSESGDFTDCHCMEFPSPAFGSFPEALKFFRAVRSAFKTYSITPQNPITVCGGGHLHFSIPDPAALRRVMRQVANSYFLPWVFTQPDDTDSCENLCSDEELLHVHKFATKQPGEFARLSPDQNCHHNLEHQAKPLTAGMRSVGAVDLSYYQFLVTDTCPASLAHITSSNPKQCLATTRHYDGGDDGTTAPIGIEFRCVESPLDESEFLDQFDFFHALVRWAEVNGSDAPMRLMSMRQLNSITPRQAIRDFKALCKTIGVDAARYRKYINRNLRTRWQLGRSRV